MRSKPRLTPYLYRYECGCLRLALSQIWHWWQKWFWRDKQHSMTTRTRRFNCTAPLVLHELCFVVGESRRAIRQAGWWNHAVSMQSAGNGRGQLMLALVFWGQGQNPLREAIAPEIRDTPIAYRCKSRRDARTCWKLSRCRRRAFG